MVQQAIRRHHSAHSTSDLVDFLLPLQHHTVPHAPPIVYHPVRHLPLCTFQKNITHITIPPSQAYSAPQLRPGHRFPMVCVSLNNRSHPTCPPPPCHPCHNPSQTQGVFKRIYELLTTQGMLSPTSSTTHPHGVHIPPALPPPPVLHLAHCPAYLKAFCSGSLDATRLRAIGFGQTTQCLVERTLAEVSGTILTALLALEYGIACNTAGGTHHAFADRGSGFCILNDLATTAKVLLEGGRVERVLIVDLDVHQVRRCCCEKVVCTLRHVLEIPCVITCTPHDVLYLTNTNIHTLSPHHTG